jgi:hypothetical protein
VPVAAVFAATGGLAIGRVKDTMAFRIEVCKVPLVLCEIFDTIGYIILDTDGLVHV